MLVLSRKVGQSLVIADGVVVTVSEIGADYVRLLVRTPNEADLRRRYPQALGVDGDGGGRTVVVTISLHHAAVLDRMRRQMSGDDEAIPSRDDALASLLDMVADGDDAVVQRLARR